MSASKLQYRDHPEMKKFLLNGVKRTGRKLGFGSFGSVEEITIGGTYYAGKKLHNTLMDEQNQGRTQLLARIVSECKLLSDVRHPNIVQFIGICFFDDYNYPVLVMEQLAINLDDLLTKRDELSLTQKLHILHDITKGLVYLHERTPPIIHRDLTTRNVLLNSSSMQAKIADLGNALMVNPTKVSSMLSQTPGTLVYMPPEATPIKPKYDSSLDMFSFGQLALYTIIQVFPVNLLPSTYEDPESEELKARSEVERRRQYFDMLYDTLSREHVLCKTVKQCLSNKPSERPKASKVVKILEDCLRVTKREPDNVEAQSAAGSVAPLTSEGDEEQTLPAIYKSRIGQLQRGTPGILEIYRSHGKVHKRSEWKQYVFQISSVPSSPTPHLTFFKSNQEGAAVDQIQLAEVHTVRQTATPFRSDDTSKHYFVVVSTKKSWLLRAYSEEECICWMEAIKSGCNETKFAEKSPQLNLGEPGTQNDIVGFKLPSLGEDRRSKQTQGTSEIHHITPPLLTPPPKPARTRSVCYRSYESTPNSPPTVQQKLSSQSSSSEQEELYDDTVYQSPLSPSLSKPMSKPTHTSSSSLVLERRYETSTGVNKSLVQLSKRPPPPTKPRHNPIRKTLSQPSLARPSSKKPPGPKPPPRNKAHAPSYRPPSLPIASSRNSGSLDREDPYETMSIAATNVDPLAVSPGTSDSHYLAPTRRVVPGYALKAPISLPLSVSGDVDSSDDDDSQPEENVYETIDDLLSEVKPGSKDYDPNQSLLRSFQSVIDSHKSVPAEPVKIKTEQQPLEYCAFIPAAIGKNKQPQPQHKPLPPTPKPFTAPKPEVQKTEKHGTRVEEDASNKPKELDGLYVPEKKQYENIRKKTKKQADTTATKVEKQPTNASKKPYINIMDEKFSAAVQEGVKAQPPPLPPKPKLSGPVVPPKPTGARRPRAQTITEPQKSSSQESIDAKCVHKRMASEPASNSQPRSTGEVPPRNILRTSNSKTPVARPRSQVTG